MYIYIMINIYIYININDFFKYLINAIVYTNIIYTFCRSDSNSWCFYIKKSISILKCMSRFMYNVLHGASLSGVPLLCRCLGHPKKGDFDEWRGAQGGVTLSHCSWLDDLELRSLQMMKRCLKSQPLKTQKARLFLGAVAEKTQKARLCLGVEERSRCLYLIHWYHFNPFYTHPIPTPTFSGYQLRPCRRWKSPARSKFMSKGLIWVFFFFRGGQGPILR